MENQITVNTDDNNAVASQDAQNVTVKQQPYIPESKICDTVDTTVPVEMMFEMNKTLSELNRKVRGIDWFVMNKLGYKNLIELCNAFSAEQVDAIAMAIYQIERGQALIVGDSTGVGKGRIAAGIMRYAKMVGKKPIFLTEKPNLFSDIYRDIIAIGMDDDIPLSYNTGEEIERHKKISKSEIIDSIKDDIENGDFDLDYDENLLFKKENEKMLNQCIEEYRDLYFPNETVKITVYKNNNEYKNEIKSKNRFVPFIVNSKSNKTDVKDADGHIIYQPLSPTEQKSVFESKMIPDEFNCVLLTYSQISSPKKAGVKMEFLNNIAIDNIVVMDESHNASGSSNTGKYLQELLGKTLGVCFLSGTYAKRPDNMPIYAMKTSMIDTGLSNDKLISAILNGGVPLQEVLSSLLVGEGQYMRRERSFNGVDVNYVYLDESQNKVGEPQFNLKEEHESISDKVTSIIRRIILFQKNEINPIIEDMDIALSEQQKSVEQHTTVQEAGISNPPVFSGIFNLINQLLFSIKADAVADYAIKRMKEGKKPVIAFASTLESFLDYLSSSNEDTIKTDFSIILKRRLEKCLEYTEHGSDGSREKKSFNTEELPVSARIFYEDILEEIEQASVGISISPIDRIKNRIREAGFTCEEVTGRNKYVEFLPNGKGYIKRRQKPNPTDVFRKFNENEYDCILINQAGSTGASAHSFKTDKVWQVNYDKDNNPIIPTSLDNKNEVKQRCMVILQAELDINKEVQKRGRINRTGQIFKPIYDYVISAIPAEERLMMMLQKKLKSLDANTSSNQKQSDKIINVVDFLNSYGDLKVKEYMIDNPEINNLTGNILKLDENNNPTESTDELSDIAHRVTGRVAILSTKMQNDFYNTVTQNYLAYEKQLRNEDKFNLEVQKLDLKAKLIEKTVVSVGESNTSSVFGGAVFVEKCEVDNLRKPLTKNELLNLIEKYLTVEHKDGTSNKLNPTEYVDYIKTKANIYFDNEKIENKESSKRVIDRRIKEIKESKQYLKLKTQKEKDDFFNEKSKEIKDTYLKYLDASEESIEKQRRHILDKFDFFIPSRVVSYPINTEDGNTSIEGIVVGIGFLSDRFVPSQIEVKIAIPNGIRLTSTPFSSPFINDIRNLTRDSYELRVYDRSKSLVYTKEWDSKIEGSQSDRIIRYIVTGNILKAFGTSYGYGKLISYSTIDGKLKKGILLNEEFKSEKIRIDVPLSDVKNLVLDLSNHSAFHIDLNMLYIFKSRDSFIIYLNKKSRFNELKDDETLKNMSMMGDWQGSRGNPELKLYIDEKSIESVLNYLSEKYKMKASILPSQFEYIKDNFDLSDRNDTPQLGEEKILKKYEEKMDEYQKSKEFEVLDEKELMKLDDLEKENYKLKEENAKLNLIRYLFKIHQSVNTARKNRLKKEQSSKEKLEDGGDLNNYSDILNSNISIIENKESMKEVINNFAPLLFEIEPISKLSYIDSISSLIIKHKDDETSEFEKIYAVEGNVNDEKSIITEIYPENKLIKN